MKPAREDNTAGEPSRRAWLIASITILIVGAILRLYDLALVPLHHDEGVNGNFLIPLVHNGTYQYNPENYHGPTLYYFAAIIPWITRLLGGKNFGEAYGLTTFNIRFVTAAFGVGTIALVLLLRNRLGRVGALSAAGLVALSPGAVYLSRYFIHESLFVFFALGIVVAGLRYYDTAQAVYLIVAALSAALMVATKETWVINAGVLVIAIATTALYVQFNYGRTRQFILGFAGMFTGALFAFLFRPVADSNQLPLKTVLTRGFSPAGLTPETISVAQSSFDLILIAAIIGAVAGFLLGSRTNAKSGDDAPTRNPSADGSTNFVNRAGGAIATLTHVLVALSVFIFVGVLFYSSFFTNYPKGVQDAFSSVTQWSGRTHEHAHIGSQYIEWLRQEELPILLAGIAGALLAVWRSNNQFALYMAQVTFGLLAAYSLVEYKTPWISLNFIVPLAIMGGYACDVAYRKLDDFEQARGFALLAGIIVIVCGYQTIVLNFFHYDDDKYPYVYAHTRRETLAMLDQIDRIAKLNGTGYDTGISIVSPDYWPLPWYFRDYKHALFYGQITPPPTEPIVIGSVAQKEELASTYGGQYQLIRSGTADGSYVLRPGVDLLLYVRKDTVR